MDSFGIEKKNALLKEDKSHEAKWDEKIKELCDLINNNPNYFTTSSCAGRITLNKNSTKKILNAFIYKTHNFGDAIEIINVIKDNKDEKLIYFRQEPCAMHVACRNLDDAIKLLKLAKEAGWKRSGIFSVGKEKIICELVSTEWIVAPIQKEGVLLVNEEYINVLVDEANKKLEKTWKKIGRLRGLFFQEFH
jgi:tRNA wybutosine-synthesizing protein 3